MCLRGTFARLVAAAAFVTNARPQRQPSLRTPFRGEQVVDLTHPLVPGFPGWSDETFRLENTGTIESQGFNTGRWHVDEHYATHLDAPVHFHDGAPDLSEIPLHQLIAPVAVIDIEARAVHDADASLGVSDVARWEAEFGTLPDGGVVVMRSGWARRLSILGEYRNEDSNGVLHFPGFSHEAAALLLERGIVGIGVDTLSLDVGRSADFPVHCEWLPSGRWGIENLANLEALPPAGATLIVGAPKVRGATGGPSRILALV